MKLAMVCAQTLLQTLLLVGITVVAVDGLASQAAVVTISGDNVIGGDPDKFACNNLCKQVVGPGCVPAAGVTCGPMTIGNACGESITKVNSVIGCEVNPAGTVDPCGNAKAPAKCYQSKGCACFAKLLGGVVQYGCAIPAGTNAAAQGDTVGSDDCP